jgi:hypothetical protein
VRGDHEVPGRGPHRRRQALLHGGRQPALQREPQSNLNTGRTTARPRVLR